VRVGCWRAKAGLLQDVLGALPLRSGTAVTQTVRVLVRKDCPSRWQEHSGDHISATMDPSSPPTPQGGRLVHVVVTSADGGTFEAVYADAVLFELSRPAPSLPTE
jgi:hypothetical protein